ncbi:MAG: META domain-containing protein [Proteobacteria bacterium]|nr:META domain-containing protein [Pseudomonadota bacterium]
MRALLLTLALAACVTTPPGTPAAHLSGTTWTMDDPASSPHSPTIAFLDARAYGFDGCNSWFASVEQSGDELRFERIGTTRRACEAAPARAASRRFLDALAATRYGHYVQDTLVLLDERQHQLARFNSDASPPSQ